MRDGLKPVHRRIVYAMYDGGYRPDRGYNKCARVVGDVMGHYHPHGDSAIYDALVRLVQDWSLRYPLVDGQGNFGSRGNDGAAAPRYTECRMAPIAMEMVRDIEQDTVDFVPNYDGKTLQPSVLPSRFPNLLVNGSAGIAVGMATQIPPHNLREVAAGAEYYLAAPRDRPRGAARAPADDHQGARLPDRRAHHGPPRHRGRLPHRPRLDHHAGRRQRRGDRQPPGLVVTELPYQVNPDMLAMKIADLVKDGKVSGIADINDETSGRTGQRLVITLKRDAVAKVVLNNLYKHTQLQTTFGANMLALVDEVPRTLPLDGFIRHWVDHQIEVIVRRTQFRLRKAEADIHVLRGYLKALDMLDEVIALIRASRTVEIARDGLIELLDDRRDAGRRRSSTCSCAASPPSSARRSSRTRRAAGAHRRVPRDPRLASSASATSSRRSCRRSSTSTATSGAPRSCRSTATCRWRTSSPRRTSSSRSPAAAMPSAPGSTSTARRSAGGKGVRGAALRGEDVVEHFFTTTTHHWLLFFTNLGRVYRAKALRAARGRPGQQGPARGQPARLPAG